MYRIFCESHTNLMHHLGGAAGGQHARLEAAEWLALLCDAERFHREREANTEAYRTVADLLHCLSRHPDQYPSTQAFLWTLESRGITGHFTGTASGEALAEMSRLVVMLLKLSYWDEVG